MAQNKDDVIAQLTAAGIDHNPEAPMKDLKALLPDTSASSAPVDADRQARWDAFLEKAEKENPLFAAQKAAGEFDKIPASFK